MNIPNKRDMSLGQIIAIAKILDFSEKKPEQRTDSDFDNLDDALSWLLDLSQSQVSRLTQETLDKVVAAIGGLAVEICFDYVKITKAANNPSLFECFPVSRDEREMIEIELSAKVKGAMTRKRKASKKVIFEIEDDLKTLPTRIWLKFLDGLLKRYERISPKQVWKYFYLIPEIISCVAWKRDESYYTQSVELRTVVDMQRIQNHKEIFLQMNGYDAFRAFGFFLTTAKPYLKSQPSRS